jgi:hypothetical protein
LKKTTEPDVTPNNIKMNAIEPCAEFEEIDVLDPSAFVPESAISFRPVREADERINIKRAIQMANTVAYITSKWHLVLITL